MEKKLKDIFGAAEGLDKKSVEFLTKALSKNNLDGFDYLEFKQSLSALSKLNMDQATAIKSTFATAATVGLTKEKLLKTADYYRKVLGKEKQQFDAALGNQMQKRVNSKKQEVEKLKGQIGKWQEQIQKLEAQIQKSQATIDNADAHIQAEMEKIEATKNNFETTYKNILEELSQDIENINLNL